MYGIEIQQQLTAEKTANLQIALELICFAAAFDLS